MIELVEMGIRGNRHLMMQDDNNLDIPAQIIDWVEENVDGAAPKQARPWPFRGRWRR